jgi:hypothetical protein
MEWQLMETAPQDGSDILTVSHWGLFSVRSWGEGDDGDEAWQPRIRGSFPEFWMALPQPPKEL